VVTATSEPSATRGSTWRDRTIAALLLAAAIGAFPARGVAQEPPAKPSPRDSAAAEALFEQGRKLLAAGKLRQACPKFAESYRLDPALGSLLNLATCHQLEGKTASAWGEFRDAEQQARRAGDAKRQKFAADKAAALEGNLPKMIVTVTDPRPGMAVARDGVALGDASFNTALPVDPGEHVISAEAPGFKRWETRFEATAGKRSSVVVPPLDRADPQVESPPTPTPASSEQPPPQAPAPGDSGITGRTVGLVIGGVGLASLAVGGAFAALFFSAKADCEASEACKDDDQHSIRHTMNTRGTISGVTLGVGAAAVIAGTIVFFMSPSGSGDDEPANAVRVMPLFYARGAGAVGAFSF